MKRALQVSVLYVATGGGFDPPLSPEPPPPHEARSAATMGEGQVPKGRIFIGRIVLGPLSMSRRCRIGAGSLV